ncbi:MAG: hypothetical protein E7449_01525 [Ruminococcaceae bacterium]|nr:hypothetical protein [Oscillospiraceae bacterium]
MQEKSSFRTVVIVLASVLLLVSLIVLAYLYFADQSTPNEIILPSTQVVGPEQSRPGEEQPGDFAVLDAENVLQVLKTLEKTNTYREVLNLTEYWQDGSATHIAEIYHRNGVTCVKVQAAKKTQCYLTDGKVVYIWYQGDEEAVRIPLSQDLTLEDLIGVPNYLEALQRTHVEEATFLPADAQSNDRIFARSRTDGEITYNFWIDIETALSTRVEILQGDTLIHMVEQREMEILMPGDMSLAYVFLLPDGTDPFAH